MREGNTLREQVASNGGLKTRELGFWRREGREGKTFLLLGLLTPMWLGRCDHEEGTTLGGVQLREWILSSPSGNNVMDGMQTWIGFLRCSKGKSLGNGERLFRHFCFTDVSCGFTIHMIWFRCIWLTREMA